MFENLINGIKFNLTSWLRYRCPNCGRRLGDRPQSIHYFSREGSGSINFCRECIQKPRRMDKERIVKYLKKNYEGDGLDLRIELLEAFIKKNRAGARNFEL